MATIPPWLNIDPVAPVGRLLEGYRLGLSASETQNANARAAQNMALAQAQAAQLNEYRQQQQAIQLEQLRMEQQKAEREAASAALQLEGQRGIQAELAGGANWPQALAKWAPKLFAGKPDDLARAMQIITPPQKPIFGTTPEGIPYAQDPRGGNVSFPPVGFMRQGSSPQPGWTPSGIEYMTDAGGGVHFPPRAQRPEGLTQAQIAMIRVKELQNQKETYQKILDAQSGSVEEASKASAEQLKKKPELAPLKNALNKVNEIQGKIDQILGTPGGQKKEDVSDEQALKEAQDKIAKILQNMPEGPSRQNSINQVIARLRARGINVTDPTQPSNPAVQPAGTGSSYGSIRGF